MASSPTTEGTAKIGPNTYNWKYDNDKHVFKVWNSEGEQVIKVDITPKAFEEIDVTALVKKEL